MPTISNTTLLVSAILFVLVLACALVYYFSDRDEVWPYVSKKPLTETEKKLYYRLREALPEHIILAQVSLYGILQVDSQKEYHKYFNKISRKSLDFLVCENDFTIVAAIELDDSSHELAERVKADYEKDTALRSAGVKIIRWPVKKFPTVATIRADVLNTSKKVGRQYSSK